MNYADDEILLVLPVPLMPSPDGGPLIEIQACNAIRLWWESFTRITVAMKPGTPPHDEWISAPQLSNVEFVTLPFAYHPIVLFESLAKPRRRLAALIGSSKYPQFAIGRLIGLEAIQLKRPCPVKGTNERTNQTSIQSAVTYLPMNA